MQVPSDVSDQPGTLTETTQGARNRQDSVYSLVRNSKQTSYDSLCVAFGRAKNAMVAVEGATLSIGMESGLFEVYTNPL